MLCTHTCACYSPTPDADAKLHLFAAVFWIHSPGGVVTPREPNVGPEGGTRGPTPASIAVEGLHYTRSTF